MIADGSAGVPERDRDVDSDFPVKRMLARIVQGNMMFFGAWFLLLSGAEFIDNLWYLRRQGMVDGFLDLADSVYDQLLAFCDSLLEIFRDAFADGGEEFWLASGPFLIGSLGGMAWYLVGRVHENRTLKKRQEARAEQDAIANARHAAQKSAIAALQ